MCVCIHVCINKEIIAKHEYTLEYTLLLTENSKPQFFYFFIQPNPKKNKPQCKLIGMNFNTVNITTNCQKNNW